MPNTSFRFKQFTVHQQHCAMKVGTDGVLLGAWADVDGATRMLDVGTGTGLVALMLAQRTPAGVRIDAVEIDPDAVRQARENFLESPWPGRLQLEEISFQAFSERYRGKPDVFPKYSHIVSNPPYFIHSLPPGDRKRHIARHAAALPYGDLLRGTAALLEDDGAFTVIFPSEEAALFIALAAGYGLFCRRRLEVKGTPDKPVKRVLMEFRFREGDTASDVLHIEEGGRHCYSEKYSRLTGEFYLKC